LNFGLPPKEFVIKISLNCEKIVKKSLTSLSKSNFWAIEAQGLVSAHSAAGPLTSALRENPLKPFASVDT